MLEDVTVTNLTMRDVTSAPLFLRLGARMRGPAGVPVGTLRRVTISNVVASGVDPHFAAIISGIPGHPIEDVRLSGIRLLYRGGYTMQQVLQQPAGGAWNPIRPAPRSDPYAVPEEEVGSNMALLAEHSGVFGETAAGVSLGALRAAVEQGELGADDRVVLLVTGDGLKTPGPVEHLFEPVRIEADADAVLERLGVLT